MTWYIDWLILQTLLSIMTPYGYLPLAFALPVNEKNGKKSSFLGRIRHRGQRKSAKETGTLPDSETQNNQLQHTNTNMTVKAKRKVLQKYKQSLEDFKWDVHTLYEEADAAVESYYRFTDDGSRPPSVPAVNHSSLPLYFPVAITSPENAYRETVVHSAKLRLDIVSTRLDTSHDRRQNRDEYIRVNIYQSLPVESGTHSRKLLDSRLVSLKSTGWLEFDVHQAINEWIEDPESNLGLEVACDRQDLNINHEFQFFHASPNFKGDVELFEDFLPYLTVLTEERDILGRVRRSRHGSPDCTPGQNKCCRKPVTVRLHDIGYDFVVEPKSVQMYFCRGTCPRDHRPAHNFVAVQQILNRQRPSEVPAPCCSPSEFRSLPYLRYDNNGMLVEKVFRDMIVTNCMCT